MDLSVFARNAPETQEVNSFFFIRMTDNLFSPDGTR